MHMLKNCCWLPIIFYSYLKLWEVIFELHHDVWDFNGEMSESETTENRGHIPPPCNSKITCTYKFYPYTIYYSRNNI